MTHCTDFESLLARAAEAPGTPDAWPLAPADRKRLASHLASCASCREALDAQAAMRALLVSRPPVGASASFRARVRQAVEAEARPSIAELLDFRRWTWRLVPVAAAMVIAATLGLVQTTAPIAVDDGLMTDTAAALPVSAAIYSTNVTDESLLGLLLGASADDPLGTVGATTAAGQEVR